MEKMGFDRCWVDMVMKCISTVSYSVNVNGIFGTFLGQWEVFTKGIL